MLCALGYVFEVDVCGWKVEERNRGKESLAQSNGTNGCMMLLAQLYAGLTGAYKLCRLRVKLWFLVDLKVRAWDEHIRIYTMGCNFSSPLNLDHIAQS
jgi:hypothetical protein